jgi:hypothetical protein
MLQKMNSTFFTSLSVGELSEIIKECISGFFAEQHKEYRQEPPADDLLSIEDIQKIFKVSKVTVHKWKKKGLIPFYKMNRKVYFKKSEVINSMCHKKRKLEV